MTAGPAIPRGLFPPAIAPGKAPVWDTKNALGVELIGQHPHWVEGMLHRKQGTQGSGGDGGQGQAQPSNHPAGPQG